MSASMRKAIETQDKAIETLDIDCCWKQALVAVALTSQALKENHPVFPFTFLGFVVENQFVSQIKKHLF